RRPEAQRKGYELDPGYSAHPLRAWTLLDLIAGALFVVTGLLAFRGNSVLIRAGPVFPFLAIAALNLVDRGVDCSSGLSSAQGALGSIALYPLAVATLAGIAALTLRRWRVGLITLGLDLVVTPYVLLSLAFTCGD